MKKVVISREKRRSILKKWGTRLQALGFVMFLCVCASEPQYTESINIIVLLMVFSVFVIFTGFIIEDLRRVCRYIVPCLIVAGSACYSVLEKLVEPFKVCSEIVHSYDSYKEAFTECIKKFDKAHR